MEGGTICLLTWTCSSSTWYISALQAAFHDRSFVEESPSVGVHTSFVMVCVWVCRSGGCCLGEDSADSDTGEELHLGAVAYGVTGSNMHALQHSLFPPSLLPLICNYLQRLQRTTTINCIAIHERSLCFVQTKQKGKIIILKDYWDFRSSRC